MAGVFTLTAIFVIFIYIYLRRKAKQNSSANIVSGLVKNCTINKMAIKPILPNITVPKTTGNVMENKIIQHIITWLTGPRYNLYMPTI